MKTRLAGQLIYEARHLGAPAYGHAPYAVPGQNSDPNWPSAAKIPAEKTVKWVLKNRINDSYAADQFGCRYLGVHVWNTKAKCY